MLLSNTLDTARPVRRRFISSWLECPNCDVRVVFGSSMSVIKIHQEREGRGGAGPRGGEPCSFVDGRTNWDSDKTKKGNLTITYSVDAARCHQRHHEVHDAARSLEAFERRRRPRRRRCCRGGGGGGTVVGADA